MNLLASGLFKRKKKESYHGLIVRKSRYRCGFTGATTALMFAQKELGDVVLVDIPQYGKSNKRKSIRYA